ncbi:MAG: CAP domain-containing protein [Lachnospiraceae bacterium]|nr:CAP domain-containing protein [Lachnospiraceae bacterium]
MALLLCVLLCFGIGMEASAAEKGSEQEISDQETSGQENAENLVMIRVEGQLEETDRDAILERINAIRKEACEEGVGNPVNGEPLTEADYVPLQWSYALEEIAVLRAVESTILQDHVRPDGRECFTAAPEGVSYTMETLAWGFESAADAVEGWYSEKSSYVEADGGPAGHYMALINPENQSVGIAQLNAKWQRSACAGAFGGENPVNAEESGDSESVWMIPLRKDLMPSVVERAIEITAGRIYRAGVRIRG